MLYTYLFKKVLEIIFYYNNINIVIRQKSYHRETPLIVVSCSEQISHRSCVITAKLPVAVSSFIFGKSWKIGKC